MAMRARNLENVKKWSEKRNFEAPQNEFFHEKILNAHRKILYQKLKKVRCPQKIEILTLSFHLGLLNVGKMSFLTLFWE